MSFQVTVNLLQQLLIIKSVLFQILQPTQGRSENKCDSPIAYDMRCDDPRAGLETFVCDFLESHAGDEEGGGLLGVANIPVDMIVGFV
jgi:hypothetical protein